MPKDTTTRYQGIYARHRSDCRINTGGRCNCTPAYWGKAWDRAAAKQRKTRMFESIGAARKARADLSDALRRGAIPATSGTRLASAAESYLRAIESGTALNKQGRKYKPSSVRDLRGALERYVVPELGARRLEDVRRGDVQRFVDKLTPRLSGSRVRTVVNSIHSLYAWAQDRELVDHDPASRVRLPAMEATPRDRVATIGEMQALLSELTPSDALAYALAAFGSARRAEIRHIRIADVDLKLNVLYLGVNESGRKSRAAQRAVPIVRPLSTLIRRSLMERGRPEECELLCSGHKAGGRNSGMLSFEALQSRADARWSSAGLRRITAHECRHTCATWLDAAGVRPVVVSMIMGHSIPARQAGAAQITQERYTHTLPGDLETARQQFERYIDAESGMAVQRRA